MNRNEDDWCHYSGMLSPKAYEEEKLNRCDMCDKLLTEGEHPNCCSDCWCANKEYYEQRLTKTRQQNKTTRA